MSFQNPGRANDVAIAWRCLGPSHQTSMLTGIRETAVIPAVVAAGLATCSGCEYAERTSDLFRSQNDRDTRATVIPLFELSISVKDQGR